MFHKCSLSPSVWQFEIQVDENKESNDSNQDKMPLIVFVGFPASGKSTRAQQLKNYFTETQQRKVVILSENNIVQNKNEVYCGE